MSACAAMPGRAKNIPARSPLLLPYQAKWVRDRSRIKLAVKSRQIGWTWATAYSLVSRKSLIGERYDAWISSRDEIQAQLFLEDCLAFARLLDIGAKSLGSELFDEKRMNSCALELSNGRRIHSMSSNPDAQAGKRGDRVLDEFALHPDPRKLYTIAYPGITWGGSLEIFFNAPWQREFLQSSDPGDSSPGKPEANQSPYGDAAGRAGSGASLQVATKTAAGRSAPGDG